MRELLVVLNTRAQSFLKRAFEFRWQTLVQNVATFLIFAGFSVAVFFIARCATDYLISQAHIGLFLFHRFLSMLLYVFFLTVHVGNIVVSFGTLYRSQEVGFLMSLPISHAKIFLIKFVDNFFYSSSTLTLLGFAMLLGYGSSFGMPWHFYFVVMFFVMLPFMLIAGILATTILMVMIQVGARIGFRLLLGLLVAAYVFMVYGYFHAVNPMSLVEDVMKLWPNVNEYLGYLDPPFVKFLPNHWVAEFLYWSIHGEHVRALPYLALLLLTMVGLIALAALIARKYYYSSWLAVSDLQMQRSSVGARESGIFRFGRRGMFTPPLDVLLKRDVALFFREPSQWLHFALMILLLVMFLVSVASLNLRFERPEQQTSAFFTVFLFIGFLVASIVLRFVFPAVSLEGDAFWTVRTSPFAVRRLYWYKVIVSSVLVLLLAEALTVSSVHLFARDAGLTLVASAVIFFVVLTLVSVNVAAGSYFAMFKEKNPIRVASSQGASLTFLGSMIYLTVVAAILMVPLHDYFDRVARAGSTPVRGVSIPLAIIGTVSAVLVAVSTAVGLKSIRRDY
jgi:ABC-2 type transport system permease protein